MMLDWNEYQKEVGARLGELSKLSPDTLKGYLTLSGANGKTTLLGVAVAMNAGAALIYSTRALDAVEAKATVAQSS
jgi:hypothetical protein